MATAIKRKRKPGSSARSHARPAKRRREDDDVPSLEQRVQDLNPKGDEIRLFTDLPLSAPTASGLEASHFKSLTDVQQKSIPLALKCSDILGAAKTGSGKTLAFLVPVLENLYRKNWSDLDGLGALILSPTRELAIQIFEVLRKIGRYHTFSAGLVIGGKSLQEERERLGRMNILVCTPGRMLQHMDQTAAFEIDNLQILVLDEADRIMDMGFQGTIDAIVEHLPRHRQTLLFSATQTKKVSDLARLSLKDPEYVSVHEAADSATPSTLQQHYIVTPLPQKLDILWSFIRANLKSKILVFLSSGKQVRFVYESFRHLQPGIPLLHLHGRQKQTARLDITTRFSTTKTSCLFATDVVARGLDFPAVDWVIQLDCPEDAETYIHRVGRTARYERNGRAVLFLEPSEEEVMLRRLAQKKVPIEKINVREKKQQSIRNQLQNMCFKDPELKYLGQKAFVSYVRSIHVQRDKEIFKLKELPLEDFSASLGLPGAPRIKFLKGDSAKSLKNAPRQAILSDDENEATLNGEENLKNKKFAVRTKYDRMFDRRNQDVLADHYTKLMDKGSRLDEDKAGDADEDNEFLTVKRRLDDNPTASAGSTENVPLKLEPTSKIITSVGKIPLIIDSKRKAKLLTSKKQLAKVKEKGTKLIFDDNGNPHPIYELQDETQFAQRGDADVQKATFREVEAQRLKEVDEDDKAAMKGKRKEKREKRKAREVEQGEAQCDDGGGAVLIPFEEGSEKAKESNKDNDVTREPDGEIESEIAQLQEPRPKKWFEDDSENEMKFKRNRPRASNDTREAELLEDLEAVASALLS